MIEHTKGEYLQDGRLVYALEDYEDRRHLGVCLRKRNRFSASVQGGPDTPDEELVAVARLFAAAPELLKACKAANVIMAMTVGGAEYRDSPLHILLAAAIAKAKGGK